MLARALECAATHNWQVEALASLEWRCATIAHAAQNINSIHSHAIAFEIDRMTFKVKRYPAIYTKTRNKSEQRLLSLSFLFLLISENPWPIAQFLTLACAALQIVN